jgi:L-fuculose-phosphate aldolase
MTDEAPLREERAAVSRLGRRLLRDGLTVSTGGNVSARTGDAVAVSPSGIPYGDIDPPDVPTIDVDGTQLSGDHDPSSETPMHLAIYRNRADVGGIVHTHSPFATTFAVLGEPIPATHYLIAYVGDRVPVAGYATYGTEKLGELAVEALDGRYNACLLQNHGVVATGSTVDSAFEVALMVEYCARVHYQARVIGEPVSLSTDRMDRLLELFEGYV